jgi:protein-L-isoaspartate(D-aspartate) O-methyltransferase
MRSVRAGLVLVAVAVPMVWGGCGPPNGRGWVDGEAGSGAGPAPAVPVAHPQDDSTLSALRRDMVRFQIEARGIRDTAVLRVMGEVPRHLFVPEASAREAYGDGPFPISHGQTISQPYIVAFMAEAADIEPGDRVLEIGTGSGYGAAVLGGLAAAVYTIEIVPALSERARRALERAGVGNVEVRTGNGWLGWPEQAPFDAIVVTAAPAEVPPALVEQLALGGVLVVPVGEILQELRVLRKTVRGLVQEATMPVRFVPMVGRPRDTVG